MNKREKEDMKMMLEDLLQELSDWVVFFKYIFRKFLERIGMHEGNRRVQQNGFEDSST